LIARVADLISPITGTWDEQLVKDTFTANDTVLVLSMPVRDDAEDFIAWRFDSKENTFCEAGAGTTWRS
jgi:hypothetical protein